MSERYYLTEVRGWRVAQGNSSRPGVSFSILDRYDCHREVATDYSNRNNGSLSVDRRRALMTRQCLALNSADSA